jgi:putative chitinase
MDFITAEKMVAAKLTDAATAAKVAPALEAARVRFGIRNVRSWLAQCATESCDFKVTVENLNYGAQALQATFSKYFTAAQAAEYAHNQERIASRVYGGRMGNGSESTGEGWKYRGRGFIQITGKNNYTAFDSDMQARGACIINPDILSTLEMAAMSAAWYWWKNNIDALADTPGIEDETKAVNGGLNGLEDRQKHYNAEGNILGDK